MKRVTQSTVAAFARVELLAVLLAVAVLAAVALPLLGSTTAHSRLGQCFNNLRQIGRGWHGWALQNNDKFPWEVPSSGGGLNNFDGQSPISVNPFVHFAILSNDLASPRIFACPSDYAKRPADNFGVGQHGLLNLTHQNSGISYFVGLHGTMSNPREPLSGDRDIRGSRTIQCGVIFVQALSLNPTDSNVAWTNIHNATGNFLLTDGGVRTVTGSGLRKALREVDGPPPAPVAGPTDILVPGLPSSVPE